MALTQVKWLLCVYVCVHCVHVRVHVCLLIYEHGDIALFSCYHSVNKFYLLPELWGISTGFYVHLNRQNYI